MNNTQQFEATFSINGQQARDELKRIDDSIKAIDQNMQKMYNDGSEGYKRQMKQYADQRKELVNQQKQMTQMSKVLKNMVRDLDKASPNQLRQTMRDINKAIDSGAIKRGTRDWKEALKVLNKCDNELRKINAEQKAFGKGGGLGSFFKGGFGGMGKLAGMLGMVTSAAAALAKIGKDLYEKNKEFEQANANLASVLGTTRDRIKDLTDQAKMLGSTTQYTATQVTQLQTELAKLGFNNSEIKASTKGILDFAAATGAELPEAASVAGAALRAFGLEAEEMDRVVSTLAVSTTKSALDFGKLQTSLSIVAPVARQFGFSIEETTALLGKLSDAGFDASSAATATRNIMLYMSDSSSKLSKALGKPIKSIDDLGAAFEELNKRGIDLAEMLDLTDKRAVAAFATMVSSGDGLVKLKEEITDCSDALGDMVDERMNTLEGSTIRLSSAWDGLMLTFSGSTGVFKSVTDLFTNIINAATRFFSTLEQEQEKDVFEGVAESTKEQMSLWKNIADSIDASDADAFMKDYADGLDNAKKKAQQTREEIQRLNQARRLGLGTAQGSELSGGLNFDEVKDRTAQLTKDLIKYETAISKYEYLQKRVRKMVEGNSTSSATQSDPRKLKIAKLENQAAKDKLAVLNDPEIKTEEDRAEKIYAIDKALFEAKRDLYNQDEKEYYDYNKKVQELEAKHIKDMLKLQDKRAKEEKARQNKLDTIERGGQSVDAAMQRMTNEELKYQGIVAGDDSWKQRQQKVLNSLRIQRDALTDTWEKAKKKIDEMEEAELSLAKTDEEKGLISEKYLQKRNELKAKYDSAMEANDKATNATMVANTKETFKHITDTITDAIGRLSETFGKLTELISADYDLQIAKCEARYDAEIEAAEKAGKDTTELEKKKEQETQRIQKKQAAAQFKADVAQTFIDSALASVKVWAEPGWPMAIPLQALIVANQAMSIATLSKQYQAKMASFCQFYDGGYTGDGERKYHRAVGIVHDGEFVANHNAVNNPEIRPALDALDYAQRTNTISSMTRGDLAAAIGYERGGYTPGTSQTVVQDDSSIRALTSVLNRLDMYGIEAHTYVNGKGGINEAQAKNTKLYKNAHR